MGVVTRDNQPSASHSDLTFVLKGNLSDLLLFSRAIFLTCSRKSASRLANGTATASCQWSGVVSWWCNVLTSNHFLYKILMCTSLCKYMMPKTFSWNVIRYCTSGTTLHVLSERIHWLDIPRLLSVDRWEIQTSLTQGLPQTLSSCQWGRDQQAPGAERWPRPHSSTRYNYWQGPSSLS